MISEIRERDQVREMLTCLREFLSACIRYPATFGAKQKSTTVTLLFHSHISIVSRMMYSLKVKVKSQGRCLSTCIDALRLAWRTTLDLKP